MEDAQKVYNKLEEMQTIYEWTITIVTGLFIVIIILFWKYINKRIEFKAGEIYEQRKTEHSVKFSNSYEKQINAIHTSFSIIQKIKLLINNREGKDKFNDLKAKEILQRLVLHRNEFNEYYNCNKIVFSIDLCEKIDGFFPKLDDYITELNEGFSAIEYTPEQLENRRKENKIVISGMWFPSETKRVTEPLNEIIEEIENEFRQIQGTA